MAFYLVTANRDETTRVEATSEQEAIDAMIDGEGRDVSGETHRIEAELDDDQTPEPEPKTRPFTIVAFYLDDHTARVETVQATEAHLANLDEDERTYLIAAVFEGAHTPAFVEGDWRKQDALHRGDEECAPYCASRVAFGECTCGRVDRLAKEKN
jgi:hypothetical protein